MITFEIPQKYWNEHKISGVIKQNQAKSEVGHIQFSVSYWIWIVTNIFKATFCRNPIEIEQPVQKISAIKEFPKQKETKGNISFVWLYLKINISDFWLILLDHITYIYAWIAYPLLRNTPFTDFADCYH